MEPALGQMDVSYGLSLSLSHMHELRLYRNQIITWVLQLINIDHRPGHTVKQRCTFCISSADHMILN